MMLIRYSPSPSLQEAHKKLMHHLTTETIDDVVFVLYIPIVESYMDNGMDNKLLLCTCCEVQCL